MYYGILFRFPAGVFTNFYSKFGAEYCLTQLEVEYGESEYFTMVTDYEVPEIPTEISRNIKGYEEVSRTSSEYQDVVTTTLEAAASEA